MKIFKNMPILLVLLLTFCLQAYAQNKVDYAKTTHEFKNQGEQEDHLAIQFFQKEYTKQNLEAFNGKIVKGNDVFIFAGDSLFVYNSSKELDNLFIRGLLYPTLIGGNHISDIEELKFLAQSPQKKRYKFLLYRKSSLNPVVCFFELTNTNTKQTTDVVNFMRGARVTFFKTAWIMI